MTYAGHGPDSLHRLVMGLHKRLNSLQSAMAQETLDGAAAYRVPPQHRIPADSVSSVTRIFAVADGGPAHRLMRSFRACSRDAATDPDLRRSYVRVVSLVSAPAKAGAERRP